jgi:hypothetical protein
MKSIARNCVKYGMKSSAKPSAPAARCYATEVSDSPELLIISDASLIPSLTYLCFYYFYLCFHPG